MPSQARVNDIGIGRCPNHPTVVQYTTVFVDGSPTVETNAMASGIISTIGICSCGHPTVATTGSGLVFKEGQPSHRVGDTGQNYGPYVVTTGSDNVEVSQ